MPSRDRYIIPELRDAWPATARLAAGEAPRVTSILALLAKEALVPLAAKLERAHMLDAMRRVLSAPTDGLARVLTDPSAVWPEAAQVACDLVGAAAGKYSYMRESRRAMDWGTRIHEAIEARLTDKPLPDLSESQLAALEQWQQWADETRFTVLDTERQVWHPEHRYAGRLDMLARLRVGPEITVVVDWKSSRDIYPEYSIQLAAYVRAVERLDGISDVAGVIVRIPKTEGDRIEPRLILASDMEDHWQAFLALRRLWEWRSCNG